MVTQTHRHTHTHTHRIYTGISFSLKNKETLPSATTWMNLDNIMLNETGKTYKGQYCMISFIFGT